MPFVTEEIWEALGEASPDATDGEPLLVRATWPADRARDAEAEAQFERIATLVRGVRNLRTEAGPPAGAWVPLVVAPVSADAAAAIEDATPYLVALARVRPIERHDGGPRPELVVASPLGAAWLGIDAAAREAASERRASQLAELDVNIARVRGLLANASFVDRAPEAVVTRERARLADLERERDQLVEGG
jgi:valyl-tRNA synthetase